MERWNNILNFWFGDIENNPLKNQRMWWTKDPELDKRIQSEFEGDVQQAIDGKYDDWKTQARSCLALVILFDQFTRNMYRNTAGAFACDDMALAASLGAIESKRDQELHLIERWFLYLPFMHAEDIEQQQRSVELYAQLAKEAPDSLKASMNSAHDFAIQHLKIIEQFGRFPHRNVILGRDSNTQEIAFLNTPNSSF